MARKTISAAGAIFYLSLYMGRYLGAVGVFGLIVYPFGWWRHYIWFWLVLVALGIFSAYLLDTIKKQADGIHLTQDGRYQIRSGVNTVITAETLEEAQRWKKEYAERDKASKKTERT